MDRTFTKMHGTGNDFVIAEPQFFGLANYRTQHNTFSPPENQIIATVVKKVCRPKFGIGADGLLIVSSLGEGRFKMSVYNSDSSFATMCGNGLRCVAAYLFNRKGTGPNFMVSTDSGDKSVHVEQKTPKLFWVTTNLGSPSNLKEYHDFQVTQESEKYLQQSQIHSVNLGNDHLFVLVAEETMDLIEKDDAFVSIASVLKKGKPFNVNFCTVKGPSTLKVVTCQNGAGVTFACGTGSASSAYAAYKLGTLPANISIETRGGLLASQILTTPEGQDEIQLSGPAEEVFTGTTSF